MRVPTGPQDDSDKPPPQDRFGRSLGWTRKWASSVRLPDSPRLPRGIPRATRGNRKCPRSADSRLTDPRAKFPPPDVLDEVSVDPAGNRTGRTDPLADARTTGGPDNCQPGDQQPALGRRSRTVPPAAHYLGTRPSYPGGEWHLAHEAGRHAARMIVRAFPWNQRTEIRMAQSG